MVDENKIAFIICTNSMQWYSECKKYIDNLEVPDSITMEVIPIWDAHGMAQGYNKGMEMTNAKYKVYMHHDVFIIERHFIKKIIQLFKSNQDIGIIGIIGANDIARKRVSWDQWECGKVIGCMGYKEANLDFGCFDDSYKEVDCVDGMLIATQYNINWREDKFTKWHFYDRSICMEFKREGYKIVVPNADEPWCIHDCGASDLLGWCSALRTFLEEYDDYYDMEWYERSLELPYTDDKLWEQLRGIVDKLEYLFNKKEYDYLYEIMNTSLKEYVPLCKQLVFYMEIFKLFKQRDGTIFKKYNGTIQEYLQEYTNIKFILRRLVYNMYITDEEEKLVNNLTEYELNCIVSANLNYSIKNLRTNGKGDTNDI